MKSGFKFSLLVAILQLTQATSAMAQSQTTSLGRYETALPLNYKGSAIAESRNINTAQGRQQVAYLMGQALGTGLASLNIGRQTVITRPITFTLARGTGVRLQIEVSYQNPGDKTSKTIDFQTPNTELQESGWFTLVDRGGGNYEIPTGTSGIPLNATLLDLEFIEQGDRSGRSCKEYVSCVNKLQINGSAVPINTTDPSSMQGTDCR